MVAAQTADAQQIWESRLRFGKISGSSGNNAEVGRLGLLPLRGADTYRQRERTLPCKGTLTPGHYRGREPGRLTRPSDPGFTECRLYCSSRTTKTAATRWDAVCSGAATN